MKKVSVHLVGLKKGITRSQVVKELAQMYGKPPSYFTPHCDHLFDLQTPYKHLAKVSPDEAQEHCKRLASVGIKIAVAEIDSNTGLSLVPVEQAAEQAQLCPACGEATTAAELCSECGVMIRKYLAQLAIDQKLQRKLAAAEQSDQRIKAFTAAEDQRIKQVRHRKITQENATSISQQQPEDDHFTIRVADQSGKRVMYFASAALLASVVGTAVFFNFAKDKAALTDQYKYAEATAAEVSSELATAETITGSPTDSISLSQSDSFTDWKSKINQIERLKNSLNVLNESVGMSSSMDGLIAETQNPFERVIGLQHLALLREKKTQPVPAESALQSTTMLDTNIALINNLPDKVEKLYACLSLAEVLTTLNKPELATNALEQAKSDAQDIAAQGDYSQRVIAEVISAEFFAKHNAVEQMSTHYGSAVKIAQQIDTESAGRLWAIPFIVRSQASTGQFADAYTLLEKIEDRAIADKVMDDITVYAQSADVGTLNETNTTLDELQSEFVDDPDMQLLIENQRIMQQNAEMLSGLVEKVR